MQFTLCCTSHQDIDDIIVDDNEFIIGRGQQPFCNYAASVIHGISRNHVKLSQDNGTVFVTDLGSSNGSTLNGQRVTSDAVEVQSGDLLCIADGLTYQVNFKPVNEAPINGVPPLQLILELEEEIDGVDSMVVAQFPFFIGKKKGAFKKLVQLEDKLIPYVSREHARITEESNELYLEDLGSTNGSFHNNKKLEKNRVLLLDGDVIAFGDTTFVFKVKIITAESEQALLLAQEKLKAADSRNTMSKTMFISEADMFLDIYCSNQKPATTEEIESASDRTDKCQSYDKNNPSKKSTSNNKVLVFFRELKGAFSDDAPTPPINKWLMSLAAVLVVAVSVGMYYKGSTEREIKELFDRGEFTQSAALANEYLWYNADDDHITDLSSVATLKHTIPQWLSSMASGEYKAAHIVLMDAGQLSKNNQQLRPMLEILGWIGKFESFLSYRGGFTAPIVAYKHEQSIVELLAWWGTDANEHIRLLKMIATITPEFDATHNQTMSQVRQLSSEKAIYVTALTTFKADLQADIDAGESQKIRDSVDTFMKRYPKVAGIRVLKDDLNVMLAYKAAIAASNLDEVIDLKTTEQIKSPPFQNWLAQQQQTVLPTTQTIDAYKRAQDKWQQGEYQSAILLLQETGAKGNPLLGVDGNPFIKRKLKRSIEIVATFESLNQASTSEPEYGQRLVAFHNSLDAQEDVYFIKQLAQRVTQVRSQLTTQMKTFFTNASKDWQRYKRNGSIRGKHRLEAKVSRTFKTQAKLLASAYSNANQGYKLHQLFSPKDNQQWVVMHSKIGDELARQKKWIKDLDIVLDNPLVQQKLNLLAGIDS